MTDEAIPPSMGKALQAILTGDREVIRQKVRSHKPSKLAQEFMESMSTKAPAAAPKNDATRPKGKP